MLAWLALALGVVVLGWCPLDAQGMRCAEQGSSVTLFVKVGRVLPKWQPMTVFHIQESKYILRLLPEFMNTNKEQKQPKATFKRLDWGSFGRLISQLCLIVGRPCKPTDFDKKNRSHILVHCLNSIITRKLKFGIFFTVI